MAESRKAAKPKNSTKPKGVKAKPATTAGRPKAKLEKAAKPAPKAEAKKPEVNISVIEKKVKKTRNYTRKPKGTLADLLKKQAELEEIKKGAKADLKRQLEAHLKSADKVKAQYKELFGESIDSAPKARGILTKKTSGKIPGLKPFSLSEIEAFVEQKKQGKKIKISGRRPKSIARLEDAYRHSDDVEEILKILNQ